jgi:hypothetical protein
LHRWLVGLQRLAKGSWLVIGRPRPFSDADATPRRQPKSCSREWRMSWVWQLKRGKRTETALLRPSRFLGLAVAVQERQSSSQNYLRDGDGEPLEINSVGVRSCRMAGNAFVQLRFISSGGQNPFTSRADCCQRCQDAASDLFSSLHTRPQPFGPPLCWLRFLRPCRCVHAAVCLARPSARQAIHGKANCHPHPETPLSTTARQYISLRLTAGLAHMGSGVPH